DPVDRTQLDELGYSVGKSIDPVVVPEHRFAQIAELVYGTAIPARLQSLNGKLLKRQGRSPSQQDIKPPGRETLLTPTQVPVLRPVERSIMPKREEDAPMVVTVTEPSPQISTVSDAERAVVSDVPLPRAPGEDTTARATPRQSGAPAQAVT